MGSSQTRARTLVPCTDRQILNHCATREVQECISFSCNSSRVKGLGQWRSSVLHDDSGPGLFLRHFYHFFGKSWVLSMSAFQLVGRNKKIWSRHAEWIKSQTQSRETSLLTFHWWELFPLRCLTARGPVKCGLVMHTGTNCGRKAWILVDNQQPPPYSLKNFKG